MHKTWYGELQISIEDILISRCVLHPEFSTEPVQCVLSTFGAQRRCRWKWRHVMKIITGQNSSGLTKRSNWNVNRGAMFSSSSRACTTRPDFPGSAVSAHGDKDYVLDSCHVIAAPLNRHLRRYQRQGVKFLYRRCFSTSSSSNHDSVKQTDDKF